MRHSILALVLALPALAACGGITDCKEDVAQCSVMVNENPEKCAEAFTLRQGQPARKHCENALKVITKQKAAAAIPGLIKILAVPETNISDDKHRMIAARALGRMGSAEAVEPLIQALEPSAGVTSDHKDKNTNRSNEEVATALGNLKDKRATTKLLEAIDRSQNNYVVLKSVRALGEIKDPAAVDPLINMALNHDNKFMRKNAVIGLGNIGDFKATDALIQMMFVEYQGVSFYKEASFGLYQLGPKVAPALLDTMAGKNPAVNKYFEARGGVKNTAIQAKCGFVLGDLRDPRAVEPLLAAFKDAVKNNDPVVMVYAAAPLGALGDKRATGVLAAEMITLDASKRDPIMRALNQLGDRSVVPLMIQAMTKGHFVKECVKAGYGSKEQCAADVASLQGAQKAAGDHASNLAAAEHYDAFKAAVDGEQDAKMKEYFTKRLVRVAAAQECKADVACWTKHLNSENPLIREKAAWELGRLKDTGSLDALSKALGDPKPESRSAAIMAYWAFGDNRVVSAIEERLEEEASSADFIRVNEDLKRLLVHLQRTGEG